MCCLTAREMPLLQDAYRCAVIPDAGRQGIHRGSGAARACALLPTLLLFLQLLLLLASRKQCRCIIGAPPARLQSDRRLQCTAIRCWVPQPARLAIVP